MDEKLRFWVLIFVFSVGFLPAGSVDPALADLDGSLVIDLADVLLFTDGWLAHDGPSDDWNAACDLSNPPDGVIDPVDLLKLAADWLVVIPEPNDFSHIADINSDRYIDTADLLDFSAAWLSDDTSENWNSACDIAEPNDGTINSLDFAVLAAAWHMVIPDPNDYLDTADINNDRIVDLGDWTVLAAAWLADDEPMAGWNAQYDMSEPNDGLINALDFAVLAKNFGFAIPDPTVFAFVPGGQFEMGDHSNTLPAASRPVHDVVVDSFYMSRFQMTNRRYCDFLNSAMSAGEIKVDNETIYAVDDDDNSHPYCDTHSSDIWSQIEYADGLFTVRIIDGTIDMAEHPMVRVNWFGAAAYCNWKSREEGRRQCYDTDVWTCDFTGDGYRLPTEAEWEYAARGGLEGKAFPWGDTLDGSMANFTDSGDPFDATTPVGYYNGSQTPAGDDMANGYGLYDMAGNVYEWCNDWFSSSYYNECRNQGIVTNPTGPTAGTLRVQRGGSWNADVKRCRTAYRDSNHAPDNFSGSYGFRICLSAL